MTKLTLCLLIPGCFAQTLEERAARLHREALVMDAHVHFVNRQLYLGQDIGRRSPERAGGVGVTLPDARDGGLKAFFFDLYVEEPWAVYNYEVRQTLRLVDAALEQIRANSDKVGLALNADDVEHIVRSGRMAAVLDLEGAFDMDGDPAVLRSLHRLGVRGFQFADNSRATNYADSACCAPKWEGINERGRALIREANRLGMVINLAHASEATWLQVVEHSKAPVISSHQGLRHFNPELSYNATDEMVRKLAAKGGIVAVHFSPSSWSPVFYNYYYKKRTSGSQSSAPPSGPRTFEEITQQFRLSSEKMQVLAPPEVVEPISRWAEVVDYFIRLVGEDAVALGSDFGGGLHDRAGMTSISQYGKVTRALLERGYSETRIRKILGGNLLRVFRQIGKGAE
jgi:membrane dipeptidase